MAEIFRGAAPPQPLLGRLAPLRRWQKTLKSLQFLMILVALIACMLLLPCRRPMDFERLQLLVAPEAELERSDDIHDGSQGRHHGVATQAPICAVLEPPRHRDGAFGDKE